MKCWHPDKIHFHPSRVADRYAKDIRAILALCRDRMSLGEGYPRSIWSRDYRDRIEINKSGLWNASAVHTNLDFEELNLNPVDNRFAFPQSPKPCICDIDTAVSNLLRSLFIPPWSTFYTTKDTLPRTLEQLVNYCACDIQTAWEPFHRVFNISISPPRIIQYTYLLSWIDIPQDLQIALGWVVLKANVPWYHPVSLVLSTFLPVSTIQAFYTYNLPPRGAHIFCFDAQGLPRDSMRKIDVPDPWTDQLRRYGRDGLDLTSDMGIRRRNWSYGERSACLKRGWCFEGEVGVPFRGVGRDLW
jgi:hypothetical protein